jgi:hypothetical protein
MGLTAVAFATWFILNAIGVGVTIWTFRRIWKRRKETGLTPKVALSVAAAAGIFGALGVALGVATAFGAVGGESVDPSQKARVLAEGIATAMNCAVFALAFWIPSLIVALFMTRASKGAP